MPVFIRRAGVIGPYVVQINSNLRRLGRRGRRPLQGGWHVVRTILQMRKRRTEASAPEEKKAHRVRVYADAAEV